MTNDNSHAHAQGGVHLPGDAHKGADAQELGQDKVIDQDCTDGNGKKTV